MSLIMLLESRRRDAKASIDLGKAQRQAISSLPKFAIPLHTAELIVILSGPKEKAIHTRC
jgi:hypothetical protein